MYTLMNKNLLKWQTYKWRFTISKGSKVFVRIFLKLKNNTFRLPQRVPESKAYLYKYLSNGYKCMWFLNPLMKIKFSFWLLNLVLLQAFFLYSLSDCIDALCFNFMIFLISCCHTWLFLTWVLSVLFMGHLSLFFCLLGSLKTAL